MISCLHTNPIESKVGFELYDKLDLCEYHGREVFWEIGRPLPSLCPLIYPLFSVRLRLVRHTYSMVRIGRYFVTLFFAHPVQLRYLVSW